MKKVFVLSVEEFSVKINAHIIQVRQIGALRNNFEEPNDWKTAVVVEKLKGLDKEFTSVWQDAGMPDLVGAYFDLYHRALKRLDEAGNFVSSSDEERRVKFGEIAVCMFITKELELMGIS